MVTFCLKRSLTIASLALSFMYESLWNFLSILPLWWSIFFITWYVTSEVIEGHERSWKTSISITLLALSLMYESFWNFWELSSCIFFHTMTCDLRGHWRSHNVIKKVNIYSISSTFINLRIFMKLFEHTHIIKWPQRSFRSHKVTFVLWKVNLCNFYIHVSILMKFSVSTHI